MVQREHNPPEAGLEAKLMIVEAYVAQNLATFALLDKAFRHLTSTPGTADTQRHQPIWLKATAEGVEILPDSSSVCEPKDTWDLARTNGKYELVFSVRFWKFQQDQREQILWGLATVLHHISQILAEFDLGHASFRSSSESYEIRKYQQGECFVLALHLRILKHYCGLEPMDAIPER